MRYYIGMADLVTPQSCRKKVVGKPCAGKLHARFDERPLRRSHQIRGLLYSRNRRSGTVTARSFRIYYQSRELARELGDPLLGTVQAASAEEAVEKAQRDADITRRAMPCCSLWAVRVRDEERGNGEQPPRRRA